MTSTVASSYKTHQLLADKRSSLVDGNAEYDGTNVRSNQAQPYSSTTSSKTNGVPFTRLKNISQVSKQAPVSSKVYSPHRMPLQRDSSGSHNDIPFNNTTWSRSFSSNESLPTNTIGNDITSSPTFDDSVTLRGKKYVQVDMSNPPHQNPEEFSKPVKTVPIALTSDADPIETILRRHTNDFTFYDGGRGRFLVLIPDKYFGGNQKDETVAEFELNPMVVSSQPEKLVHSNKRKVTNLTRYVSNSALSYS